MYRLIVKKNMKTHYVTCVSIYPSDIAEDRKSVNVHFTFAIGEAIIKNKRIVGISSVARNEERTKKMAWWELPTKAINKDLTDYGSYQRFYDYGKWKGVSGYYNKTEDRLIF